MKVKIAHLYDDIANLYGENANVRMMEHALLQLGATVQIDYLSLEDDWHLESYDFLYVGTFLDENYSILKKHFQKYKTQIKSYIENGGFVLATGTGLNLFSSVLMFKTQEVDFRIMGDQVYKTSLVAEPLIGFSNRNTILTSVVENTLFEVVSGTGYSPKASCEGIQYQHFYGTYLLGPILVRNPHFLRYLVQELVTSKGGTYHDLSLETFDLAYQTYLENFPIQKESNS